MLKLLFALPCQQVLVDVRTNGHTLAAILEELNLGASDDDINSITKPANVEQNIDPAIFLQWSYVAYWQAETSDLGEYNIKLALKLPGGALRPLAGGTFMIEKTGKTRTMIHLNVFPIGGSGIYNIIFEYKKTSLNRWSRATEYPIVVKTSQGIANVIMQSLDQQLSRKPE